METMKHVQAIEYRNKTEPPIETGWYYARYNTLPGMDPVPVYYWAVKDEVSPLGSSNRFGVAEFDWFGPVRIVKEG